MNDRLSLSRRCPRLPSACERLCDVTVGPAYGTPVLPSDSLTRAVGCGEGTCPGPAILLGPLGHHSCDHCHIEAKTRWGQSVVDSHG